jgi:CRISPR system Cascade subunit CasE
MTHWFSRASLQARPRNSELLRRLSRHEEAYRDHALVWRLFPGDGNPRDFVFRREDKVGGSPVYYIVSRREPCDVDGLFQLQSKPYWPRLAAGTRVHFDLRANPTVSRRHENGVSRRHDVLMDAKRSVNDPRKTTSAMEEAGHAWLLARASHWGLEMDGSEVLQTGYRQHRLTPKGKRIEFSSLDYRGAARVADPEALSRVLLDGVGHARGFGCGLLLVKRIE